MDKQNTVYTYSGVFTYKRMDFETCYNVNLENIMLSEITQITKRQILYDSIYMRYLEESNS